MRFPKRILQYFGAVGEDFFDVRETQAQNFFAAGCFTLERMAM